MIRTIIDGKTYYETPSDRILVDAPLPYAVFVFLPRNNRVVRIRDIGAIFEAEQVAKYSSIKNSKLLLEIDLAKEGPVEEAKSPGGFESEGLEKKEASAGVDSLAEGEKKAEDIDLSAIKQDGLEAPTIGDVKQTSAREIDFDYKPLGKATKDASLDNAEAEENALEAETASVDREKSEEFEESLYGDKGNKRSALAVDEDDLSSNDQKAFEREEEDEQRISGEADDLTATSIDGADEESSKKGRRAKLSEFDEEIVVKGGPIEKEVERRVNGKVIQELEGENRFSEDRETLDSRKVRGNSEEDDVERVIKGIREQKEAAQKIIGEIEKMEKKLIGHSDSGKSFLEEERRLKRDVDAAQDEIALKGVLEDELESWDKVRDEERAASKLSVNLGNHLTAMRMELAKLDNDIDKGDASPETIARRDALQKEVLEHERTLMLLETLDDPENQQDQLPEDLRKLSKTELVEEAVGSIKNLGKNQFISKEDEELIVEKLTSTKVKESGVYAEKVNLLRKNTKRMLESDEFKNGSMSEEKIKEIERKVNQDVKSTVIANALAKQATELREELLNLLSQSPSTKEERSKIEEKAKSLTNAIQERENLIRSLDAGSAIPEERLRNVLPNFNDLMEEIHINPDDPDVQAKVLSALEKIEEETTKIRSEETASAKALQEKILSDEKKEASQRRIEADVFEDFEVIVKDFQAREPQAAVHALSFLQSFGYQSPKLEKVLVETCLLAKAKAQDLDKEIEPEVLDIHTAAFFSSSASIDPVTRDMVQAIRMAVAYNAQPEVITGKFDLDVDPFQTVYNNLISKPDPSLDYQLLERARQAVVKRHPLVLRKRNVETVVEVGHRVTAWRQRRNYDRANEMGKKL